MINISQLLDHNPAFAGTDARRSAPALPFLPRQGLYIVICIDWPGATVWPATWPVRRCCSMKTG
jgi:hypothetical protein